jgi:DNA-binding MarR family transcriptional regulator
MAHDIPRFPRQLDRPRIHPDYRSAPPPSAEQLISLARDIFSIRERRRDFLSDQLLGEPAWDMMLALYVASLEERSITVSNLAADSGVPATTALRWLGALRARGFARSRRHKSDGRVTLLTLDAEGLGRMTALLTDAWVSLYQRHVDAK